MPVGLRGFQPGNTLGTKFAYQGGKRDVICVECGGGFQLYPSDITRGRRFCSQACADHVKPGRPRSRAAVQCAVCGASFEVTTSRVARGNVAYCSKSCRSHAMNPWRGIHRSGSANPNWKGGIAELWEPGFYLTPTWIAVATTIRKRDSYHCRDCGDRMRLHVHHIVPMSSGGAPYDLDNLIALCSGCHIDRHRALREVS